MVGQLSQLTLDIFTLGNIANNTRQGSSLKIRRVPKGHFHWRDSTTFMCAQHFDTALQPKGTPVLIVNNKVLLKLIFVAFKDFRGKQHSKVLAQELLFGISESPCHRTVGKHNIKFLINSDNSL